MFARMTYINETAYGYFNVLPALETLTGGGKLYSVRFSWLWFSLWWDFGER